MSHQDLIQHAEKQMELQYRELDAVAEHNLQKVLRAMKRHRLSDMHFNWNTGYGYDDAGREVTEKIFADVLGKEDALVRTQISSGTHALSLMLTGLVRPGQTIVSITGKPYDTLEPSFGIRESKGISLKTVGACYRQIDLRDGEFDLDAIRSEMKKRPDYVYIQRSPGYSWRRHFSVCEMNAAIQEIKSISSQTVVLLDNCYGEFTETDEPMADVIAGSLIKNPGGGLALSGGYIAGGREWIETISERLTAPGIGREIGLTFGQTRNMLQGLFMAPTVVKDAMKGAFLIGSIFHSLGYRVSPNPADSRGHIIQAIELGEERKLLKFCEAVQACAPVNSYVTPVPAPMPGYEDPVIMAAGTFVQGSSIEMSADGPVKPPYIVYFQGGLNYEHIRIAIKEILKSL